MSSNNPNLFVHFSEGQKNVLFFTQQCLHTKSVLFAHILIKGRKDQLTKSVVDTTLADRTVPWTKRVQSILEEVGIQDLKNFLQEYAQETEDAGASCFPASAGESRTLFTVIADRA